MNRSKDIRWSSHPIFVMAAAGTAAGLGHLWQFPALASEHGGGAFVLVYVACLLLLGTPLLLAEILLGRAARRSPLRAFRHFAPAGVGRRVGSLLGWIGLGVALLVASMDAVVGARGLYWLGASLTGGAPSSAGLADAIVAPGTLWIMLGITGLTVVAIGWSRRGITRGVEVVIRFAMPLLLGLLAVVLAHAALSSGFGGAASLLFQPDWHSVTLGTLWAAMGHALTTLGVGLGVSMAYSAYLPADSSPFRLGAGIVGIDLVVTLAMALILLTFAASAGEPVPEGSALLFGSVTTNLAALPFGAWVMPLLFLIVVLAALISIVTLSEPALSYLVEEYNARRPRVAITWGVFCWLLGAAVLLVFDSAPASSSVFMSESVLLDVVSQHALLLVTLVFALFAGWRLPVSGISAPFPSTGSGGLQLWRMWVGILIPLAIAAALVDSLIGTDAL
ncbi:MAG: sodium-dependent transporter [Pseudomonadales bacterium]